MPLLLNTSTGIAQLLAMLGNSGLTYLLRDEFTTDASAPLTSPRTAEPGPGTLTLVQNDGQFSISGGALSFPTQTTAVYGDQYAVGATARAAVNGRLFICKVSFATNGFGEFGWVPTATPATPTTGFQAWRNNNGVFLCYDNGNGVALPITVVTSTDYYLAVVRRATGGCYFFIKGGVFANWTLAFIGAAGTADGYPALNNYTCVGTLDYIRVTDLPAPFSTDALATINVTSATQSLGSELLTNGDFSAWSGNNPTSWALSGETAGCTVSESAANGSAGNGSAHFEKTTGVSSTPSIREFIGAIGNIVEAKIAITANAGASNVYCDEVGGTQGTFMTVGTHKMLYRQFAAAFRIGALSTANADFVIDDASFKTLTLNAAQTISADSIIDFALTVPAAPVSGDQAHLCYRINASGEEFYNCWDAYIVRNDGNTAWDFKLDSIVTGTRTNRVSVTGVGDVTQIRTIANGNNHDCYTLVGTTWTKRGSTINNSTYATATLCNTIYTSGFTFGSLTAWPVTSSNYNALNNV